MTAYLPDYANVSLVIQTAYKILTNKAKFIQNIQPLSSQDTSQQWQQRTIGAKRQEHAEDSYWAGSYDFSEFTFPFLFKYWTILNVKIEDISQHKRQNAKHEERSPTTISVEMG